MYRKDMRLFVTGGDAFEPHIVAETIETITKANKWALASLILEEVREGAGQLANDWAQNKSVRVVESKDFLDHAPDAAVLFPGRNHRAFRALMMAGVPVYRVTPEGRYTKYNN